MDQNVGRYNRINEKNADGRNAFPQSGMEDHNLNEDIREQMGITDIKNNTRIVRRTGYNICKKLLQTKSQVALSV
jgi:hypothetical protein